MRLIALALILFVLGPSVAQAMSGVWAPGLTVPGSAFAGMADRPDQLLFGLLIGIMLAASLYLFFIWTVIRDPSQILLMLMLVALMINMGVVSQVGGVELFSDWQFLSDFSQQATLLLFYSLGCFFTVYFLEIDHSQPQFGLLLRLWGGALLAVLALAAFDPLLVGYFIPLIGLLTSSLIIIAGVRALLAKVTGARTHVLAFLFLLAGGLTRPLNDLGLLEAGFISNNLLYFASAIAALIFAVGIAGQFGSRQEDKDRQIRISNERFALAALGSNDGLYDWSVAEQKLFFSDRFRKIIGQEIRSTPGGLRQWLSLIAIEDRTRVRRAVADFLRSAAVTLTLEYRIRRRDKTERWLYTTAVALREPQSSRLKRLVGSVSDITAKKQADEALRESEARFRNITEAHPVPVLICNLYDGVLYYASPALADMLGAPLESLLGQPLMRFFASAAECDSLLHDLARQTMVASREVELMRISEKPLSAALAARLIDYNGVSCAVIGVYDLTERKSAESQIAHQRRALEQSEKMAALGSLLAGVAHELNNPLSVVVGQASLLLESAPDPKTQTRAEKIKNAAERCAKIVKNFLALARHRPPERSESNINSTINSALDLLLPQLKKENIDLRLDLDSALPRLLADPDQLAQVFTNLIINACHVLSDKDGPRRIVLRSQTTAARDFVIVTVADNGAGIPTEIRQKIFEPFFTTKPAGKGTGIGLSLCLNIIEGHGGTIKALETPGGGATFEIRLPVAADLRTQQAPAPVVAAQAAPAPSKNITARLLLVDDEPEILGILADIMSGVGHTVTLAEHGAHALRLMREATQPFDLVISDMRMPEMDGPSFYRQACKELPYYRDRVMFCTGDTLSPQVRDFLAEYPVLMIDKPYLPEEVKQQVQKQLQSFSKTLPANELDKP